jgi:acyl dehydratase
MVGASTAALTKTVDARWLMAYAAGIGDDAACYFDTGRPAGIVGHPLFPVCVEWDQVLAARALVSGSCLSFAELLRGVHATHDLRIHRLVRPGDVLTTTATVEGVERRRPGAYETLRFDTVDATGAAVSTTRMGSLFLGVDVDGPDRPAPDPSAADASLRDVSPITSTTRAIAAGGAHVYTECSRIWNPIHTDAAVAAAASLPGIILHGTATLAIAITEIVSARAVAPTQVRRVRCRFGAMVRVPSVLTVHVSAVHDAELAGGATEIFFDVRNEGGDAAIKSGSIVIDRGAPSLLPRAGKAW